MTVLEALVIRGGTSRAVFTHLDSLPDSPADRDELCRRLIGAPDPVAIDGLGGGVSSNSKVMFVGPSTRPGIDLESFFAQVTPDGLAVDYAGNCGNITSGVSVFALHTGLISRTGSHATVRVFNRNTSRVLELAHPLDGGQLPTHGDFRLDGVAGSSARIDVRFLAPGGEKTGSIFPAGRLTTVNGIQATLIDVTNPIAIVRASDVTGELEELMQLREAAGQQMGLAPSPAIPRVAVVDPRPDGDLNATMTTVGGFHHALPATGILALGAAVALGDTVIDLPARPETRLHHPKGTATVSASLAGDQLEWVALARSARLIMEGRVHL